MARTSKTPPPLPEQLENEPDGSYSLFCEYCQLGPKRSIRALSELVGRSRPVLGSLSLNFRWPDRAAAWDRSAALAPNPSPDRVAVLGDRRAKLAGAIDGLIDLTADMIQSIDPLETSPRSVNSLAQTLTILCDLADRLEPTPSAELAAAVTLIPSLDPRIAGRFGENVDRALGILKGDLDAALELGLRDEGAIDVDAV